MQRLEWPLRIKGIVADALAAPAAVILRFPDRTP